MKLYTRSGDDGTTGLFGGQRVGKDHPRVEAYGTVDELNAVLGLAAAATGSAATSSATRMHEMLTATQSRLFDIGADLATPEGSPHESKIVRISGRCVAELEAWIDETDSANDPMEHFVLPGGSELAARLHLARTVCRRAERLLVALAHTEAVTEETVVYLNRLGDLLFAMARRANKDASIADVPWVAGER